MPQDCYANEGQDRNQKAKTGGHLKEKGGQNRRVAMGRAGQIGTGLKKRSGNAGCPRFHEA